LASRLRALTAGTGSTFSLKWKTSTTPSGRFGYLLRASGPRTDAPGFGSWPDVTGAGRGQFPPHGYANDSP
jgi:hypothetical protein